MSDNELALAEKKKERLIGGVFLATVAGMSAIAGFSRTLSMAKRRDPKYFDKGVEVTPDLAETGAMLAIRALGWGTLYAFLGTGAICYGIWKLSGANDLQEFRYKMGNILPQIKRNDPPQSRTEFDGLNDLMTYLADWGKSDKIPKTQKPNDKSKD